MATVRMAKLSEKVPSVTVHIRGKGKQRSNWNNTYTWNAAATLRVNMYPNYPTCPNGELDEDLTWLDVHNVVEEVKGVMA